MVIVANITEAKPTTTRRAVVARLEASVDGSHPNKQRAGEDRRAEQCVR